MQSIIYSSFRKTKKRKIYFFICFTLAVSVQIGIDICRCGWREKLKQFSIFHFSDAISFRFVN